MNNATIPKPLLTKNTSIIPAINKIAPTTRTTLFLSNSDILVDKVLISGSGSLIDISFINLSKEPSANSSSVR